LEAGSSGTRPPAGDVLRDDEIGRDEPAPRAEQPPDQTGRDSERRVGHDPERPTREPEVGAVGLDHRDRRSGEAAAERVGAPGMELDGHDPGTGRDQRNRERAGAGPDIEHEVAGADAGGGGEPPCPRVSEAVEPPPEVFGPPLSPGGHGAPSPSSRGQHPASGSAIASDFRAGRGHVFEGGQVGRLGRTAVDDGGHMLQITQEATGVVQEMRAQRGIPDDYGLRVYSDNTDDGQQAIRLGFADEPFEGDQVTEAEAARVFVSPDLADALSDIVIDVDQAGEETRLVLRPT